MQAFVDRFRDKASKARQAQSRLKALERLPAIEMVAEATPARFDFPEPAAIAPPVPTLERVAVGYGGAPVLRAISTCRIDPDDRIALLGANGNGKSTFAKLLAGRLPPLRARWRARQAACRLFRPAPGRGAGGRGKRRSSIWPRPAARAAEAVRAQLGRFGLEPTAPRRRSAISRAASGRG